jgi:DNA replication protein DnaC
VTTTTNPRRSISGTKRDPKWQTHASFENRHPDYGAMARAYEQQRRALDEQQGREYVPGRDFPCRGTVRFVDRGGPIWIAECDACGFEIGIPRASIDRAELIGDRVRRSRLPDHLRGEAFLDVEHGGHGEQTAATKALRLWIEHFVQPEHRPRAPILFGGTGRGKTHLLTLTGMTLIRRHLTNVYYCSAVELIAALKDAMGDGGVPEVLRRSLEAECLVLDDLGAERGTDYAVEQLYRLVDHREREGLPIIAATNLRPAEWPDQFGSRTASRLMGLCEPIEVGGPDWRVTGRPEGSRGLHVIRGGQHPEGPDPGPDPPAP